MLLPRIEFIGEISDLNLEVKERVDIAGISDFIEVAKLANGIGNTSDFIRVVNAANPIGDISDFMLVLNEEKLIGDINDDLCLPVKDPGKFISFGMLISFAIMRYSLIDLLQLIL